MSEKSKELSEMVAKLCSVVDQESVHVPAGFLRELEKEMLVLRSTQSETRRESAMQALHKVTQDASDAERRLDICRRELGRAREELVELRGRYEARVAGLEEDMRELCDQRDRAVSKRDPEATK